MLGKQAPPQGREDAGSRSRAAPSLPHAPNLVLRAEERRKRSPKQTAARWLSEERVIAFLKSDWRRSPEGDESHLVVAWFQEPGNPCAELGKIVAELDWTAHAAGWYC